MLRLVNFNMLFELVQTKFSKVNCFRVYRKLVTWSSHAKSLYEVTESTLRVLYMTYLSASLRNQNGVLPNLRVVSLKSNESRTSKDLPYIYRLPIWRHDSCGALQNFVILLELTEKSPRKLMKVTWLVALQRFWRSILLTRNAFMMGTFDPGKT